MDSTSAGSSLVGRSLEFDVMIERARKLADLPQNILITGESGTGKTVLASFVHEEYRAPEPFVHVDCTLLRGEFLASDIFGHVKGAFTGACSDRAGKLQTARNGTVFLDEIGEMTPDVQAKFLIFLNSNKYSQMGSDNTLESRARIIAGTNVDLETAMKELRFRHDLYGRFHHKIHIKPLRERRDDIPCLFMHLWERLSRDYGFTGHAQRLEELSEELATIQFDWPFNVRSIEQLMREAMLSARPDEKKFVKCFRDELFNALNTETISRRVSLQDELANYIQREFFQSLSSKSDKNLNMKIQSLLEYGLEGALQKLMESGITLGGRRCTAIGKLLGHKTLGNKTTGNPLDSKNAQHTYIDTALIGLYRRHSDTDLLRYFLGDELFQIVGQQAHRKFMQSDTTL